MKTNDKVDDFAPTGPNLAFWNRIEKPLVRTNSSNNKMEIILDTNIQVAHVNYHINIDIGVVSQGRLQSLGISYIGANSYCLHLITLPR